jgi:hypothetical protein
MQSQSSQPTPTGDKTQEISSWLKGQKDPTVLSHIAREVFGQIETLDSNERQQVYSQLRNDVKFQNSMTNFSPQTA